METFSFPTCFKELTGHPPFRWQERLYQRLLTGDDIPSICDVPTGLGKTSVLTLWLLALAEQASHSATPLTLPRRLVYIVDRRVVVDQATADAEGLLKKLRAPEDASLVAVADALRGLAAVPHDDGQQFALSTLRGQFADNHAWSHDPARPAIIVGTVDMIGSRLLFSGYGRLRHTRRSHHAALLGQDALVVLDEAQLAPAFKQTLEEIERLARSKSHALRRPFAFMSLTATQPPKRGQAAAIAPVTSLSFQEPSRVPLTLEPEDFLREETVRRRVRAAKALRFIPPESGATGKPDERLAQRMAQEAALLGQANGAVVVFVNTVAMLDKVYDALSKLLVAIPKAHCLRFTGQMRGYERDLAFAKGAETQENKIFQAFRRSRPRSEQAGRDYPVFLLATSAGEVGVDFDADHAVCDLVSLERVAQRLGRVNRAGDYDGPAHVTVFLTNPPEKLEGELVVTYHLLRQLPAFVDLAGNEVSEVYSASPESLGFILNDPDAPLAFTPASDPPPLDPARLDDWSLTSLSPDDFPRPQVSYWLRGITPDDDQAVTRLVWREELRYARDKEDAADLAETRPPLPHEIVQVPTYRAVKWLLARAKKHLGVRKQKADPHHGEYAAVRTSSGEWEPRLLKDFEEKENFEAAVVGATIMLPTTFGGLSDAGIIDDACEDKARDVLEEATGPDPSAKCYRRVLLSELPDARWAAFDLLADPVPTEIITRASRIALVRKLSEDFSELTPDQSYRLIPRKREAEESAGRDDDGNPPSSAFRVEYFVSTKVEEQVDDADLPSLLGQRVLLRAHLEHAEGCAKEIVKRLNLPPPIQEAVVLAARWHDLGKDRDHWQRAIGNSNPAEPWAKSAQPYFNRQETQGYRHEFGSLMEAAEKLAQQPHPESDLILHLIAAHHGHGRPGFQAQAYDVPKYLRLQCAEAADAAELRFDRLQRRFGWWGLAYLEALVKCADGIASDRAANPSGKASSRPVLASSEPPELFSTP